MLYCPGLDADEGLHKARHSLIVNGVSFSGWKSERVVESFSDGSRIVCVRPHDPVNHLQKAAEVKQIAEMELGARSFGELEKGSNQVAYFLVSRSKHVVGFLLTDRIMRAYRVLVEADSSSNTPAAEVPDTALKCRHQARVALIWGCGAKTWLWKY